MKITLKSDKPVDIRILVKFKNAIGFWELESEPHRVRLSGKGSLELAIPGRRPCEIDHFVLKYNNQDIIIYPEFETDGEIAPIVIYDGSQDYWTQKLREAAFAVKP